MRDPELLISLLREMSDQINGHIYLPYTMGAEDEEYRRHHHGDLLVDAGHAMWQRDKQGIRITTQGYDFLNAIEKQDDARSGFLQWMQKGMDYANAAIKAVELASKLAGAP